MAVLPDVLRPNLRIVFCGVAAGRESARRGVYYSGRGNRFWSVLAEIGLVPRLDPDQFETLPQYGIGLTDLAKKASGSDAEIMHSVVDVDALREKIERYSPRVLAFNGKKAAQTFLRRKVAYGIQRETVGRTLVFVLPSTSGAANGYWDIAHWRVLAELAGV